MVQPRSNVLRAIMLKMAVFALVVDRRLCEPSESILVVVVVVVVVVVQQVTRATGVTTFRTQVDINMHFDKLVYLRYAPEALHRRREDPTKHRNQRLGINENPFFFHSSGIKIVYYW
ncbi:d6.1 [Ichnoviriform fugitivi]|uniref:D6.1 n=1 Tax=Ichnoviriform fugitivi TaxID=265522 RepID=A2Q0L1_9VIRU|nr:d6.1 [Ichnoviriform fugitivi]BAF45726.1 d6.1 [Ichnoviriform fugitivi]